MAQEIPCPFGIIQDFCMGWSMGTFASYPYHWWQARKRVPKKPPLQKLDNGIDSVARKVRRRAIVRSWKTGKAFGRWTGVFAMCGCFLPVFTGPASQMLGGAFAGGLTGGILCAFFNGFRQGFIILLVLEAAMHFSSVPDVFPMQTLEAQEGTFEERRKQAIAELEEIANRDLPYSDVDPVKIKELPGYERRLLGIE